MPSKIEWCDEVWNPVTGCSPVSAGCQNCWARRMANRLKGRYGYPKREPFKVTLHPDKLGEPLRWRNPRRVFVVSMGDLFHKDVPENFLWEVFGTMADCPQHTFLVLTKRPERMSDWMQMLEREWTDSGTSRKEGWDDKWGHVWPGVTAENQEHYNTRVGWLQTIVWPGKRFVSCEPLLGPIDADFSDSGIAIGPCDECGHTGANPHCEACTGLASIDWIIAGGESGPGARPMHPDWARGLRDQAVEAGVAYFFKGWGEWAHQQEIERNHGQDGLNACAVHYKPHAWMDQTGWSYRVGKKLAGRLLDGRTWDEYPEVKT